MSFATFGFAYVARPVGAVILGHFGDRVGRQKVLMFTLVLMGASTFVIGCLPDFNTVGWWAPALLVLARLCQGLSAAGEQAGASSMTLEHAPDNRRSFFTSWTLTGTQGGQILAALVFIPVLALPDEIKYGIGWRIPFWLSAVVVLVAFFIRRTLHEPPAFAEAQKTAQISKLPVADLLKGHWRDVLRVVCCAFIAAVSTVFGTLAISYAKTVAGVDGTTTLWLVVGANFVALGTQPLFGMLADRIGRKPVFIYGALASAILTPVFLLSLESGSVPLMFLAAIGYLLLRIRRRQRRLAVLLRRNVQHQGPLLRPGHRHAAGLPDGRLRSGHRGRHGWHQARRLGPDQHLHRRHLRHRSCLGHDGQGIVQDPHQAARPQVDAPRSFPVTDRTKPATSRKTRRWRAFPCHRQRRGAGNWAGAHDDGRRPGARRRSRLCQDLMVWASGLAGLQHGSQVEVHRLLQLRVGAGLRDPGPAASG